jgi:Alginate export
MSTLWPTLPRAQEASDTARVPDRPVIMFNRWQEDWSVLADPRVPRQPFDFLKYIPLSEMDAHVYLSLGATVRERFETNDSPLFGLGPSSNPSYLLSRTEAHADLRVGEHVQVFAQLQSDFAPWKSPLSPPDRNRLDLEQAFAVMTYPVGNGTLKLRLGRQQMAFDLQRFVSVRDGPNVRQSYDALWADYEIGPWRFIGFYSWPVQTLDERVFDDASGHELTFGGLRVELQLSRSISISAYYARFGHDQARYLSASGDEHRDIFDVHFTGTAGRFDWDVEGMVQLGHVGSQSILAWGMGSVAGYTFAGTGWTPRIGLQVDVASGDDNRSDQTLGTFNPLFPNGAYLTLAGYTGYVNFVHVKPSLTLHPSRALKLMVAIAPQWRQTTADAVYAQPNIPVPNTAGTPGSYTGTYGQVRLDWQVSRSTSVALEAVHFQVGDVIRNAGGRDSNYVMAQIAYGF